MGVNNLPRVVAWRCTGRELNMGPLNLESNMLTTIPPSHLIVDVHVDYYTIAAVVADLRLRLNISSII